MQEILTVTHSYDNTDGHMTSDVPGFSPPRNKGVYTLKQYVSRKHVHT